jgi:hypothetical protein
VAGTEKHYLNIAVTEDGEEGFITLFDSDEGDEKPSHLTFRISNMSGVLELTSPISKGIIVTAHGVVLKARFGDIELGPDLLIIADSIEFVGKKVVATAGSRQEASVMLVARTGGHDSQLEVKSYPQEALAVYWEDPWVQFRPYIQRAPRIPAVDPAKSMQVLVGLRRILRSFHQGASGPTIYGEMLDRLVVGENRIFGAVLNALQRIGVVKLQGSSYGLVLEKMGEYKISWAAINGPEFSSALKLLLDRIYSDEEVAALITR